MARTPSKMLPLGTQAPAFSLPDTVSGQILSLDHNHFEGIIPSTIGNFLSLKHLDLSNNEFNESFPISISQCGNLQYLNVSYNKLTGCFPKGVIDLPDLTTLDYSNNGILDCSSTSGGAHGNGSDNPV